MRSLTSGAGAAVEAAGAAGSGVGSGSGEGSTERAASGAGEAAGRPSFSPVRRFLRETRVTFEIPFRVSKTPSPWRAEAS